MHTSEQVKMLVESELYSYFTSIAEMSQKINRLSMYLDFNSESDDSKRFIEAFDTLLIKHRESLDSVIDLFRYYNINKNDI